MTGINQSFTTDEYGADAFPTEIDLGFKPKVVFMMGAGVPTASIGTSFVTHAWGGFGWSTDPSNEQTSVGSGGFQTGAVPGGSYISESVFAALFSNTDTRSKQIDMVSFDCDTSAGHPDSGYTMQTASTLQTGVVPTIALGGNNIEVANGSFSWPSGAGNVAVTGVGFEPQLVMFLWSKTASYNATFSSVNNGSSFGFGAGSSADASEQFALYTVSQGGKDSQGSHVSGKVCVVHATTVATATIASMDADGFTLTFSAADTGETTGTFPRLIGWIALRDSGGGFKVGNAVIPGSTGTVGYTGCGFAPDQVILAHANKTVQDATEEGGGAFGIGMFDDTLQTSILNGEELIAGPNYSARRHNSTAIAFGNFAGGIDGEADRDSIDADGFTLDWTNVGFPGRPFGWIAIKTTGGNSPCGPDLTAFIPQIYRRL